MRRCAALPSSPARPGSSVASSCRCCSTTAISRRSSCCRGGRSRRRIRSCSRASSRSISSGISCCRPSTTSTAASARRCATPDRVKRSARSISSIRSRSREWRLPRARHAASSFPRWAPIATSRVFYNRIKGELEEELMRLELRTVYAFRPSLLAGQRTEVRVGERAGARVRAAALVPAARAHPPDRRRRRRARDARVRQAQRRGAVRDSFRRDPPDRGEGRSSRS